MLFDLLDPQWNREFHSRVASHFTFSTRLARDADEGSHLGCGDSRALQKESRTLWISCFTLLTNNTSFFVYCKFIYNFYFEFSIILF